LIKKEAIRNRNKNKHRQIFRHTS